MTSIFLNSPAKKRTFRPVFPFFIRPLALFICIFLYFFIIIIISSQATEIRPKGLSQQTVPSSHPYYLNPARELPLLKKILVFERRWKSKAGQELKIGILYQKSSSISFWAMEDWLNLQESLDEADRQLYGISISFQKIELEPLSALETTLAANRIQILYLTPIEPRNTNRILAEITKICNRLKIGTFSAVPEYLDSGVAIGFQLEGQKPQIFINLDAARAQGFDFSSQFLRLVKRRGKND